jgi:predicted dehydrogenase
LGYKAAVIGCGRIGGGYPGGQGGASHAGAYRADERVCLAAGADIDPEARERFGRRWGVSRLYANCEELLAAERPELVSVCTWDPHHGEAVRAAAQQGARVILCEKPLAPTWEEARALQALCARRQVELVVGYQRRWEPRHRQVRDFIRAGGLGQLLAANGYYVGGLRHNGCAWINLARFLLGEVLAVRALGGAEARGGDADLGALLEFAGFQCSLHAACRQEYSIFEIDVLGTRGRITLADAGYELRQWRAREDERFPGFRSLGAVAGEWGEQGMDRALHAGVRQIVDHLEGAGQGPLENPGSEAVIDMQIVEAIFQSHREGGPVALGQAPP